MKLFIIQCQYASARALAVESRADAFDQVIGYFVGGIDQNDAKATLLDHLCSHVDDEVKILAVREVNLDGFIAPRL